MLLSKFRPIGMLATLFTAAAAQPALATDQTATLTANQVRVQYGDLNLQSAQGAESLVTRIAYAASLACGGRPMYGPVYQIVRKRYMDCIKEAEGAAVNKVDQPLVTAAHARRQNGGERMAAR